MPTTSCPLFAAGFDWLEALLPFLFVAFWIISQVFAVFRRLQGGGQRPQQPPVRIDRPRVGPQPAQGGDDVRSELERQIQEFLRQATGEQARPPAAGQRGNDPPQRSRPPRPIEQPRADRTPPRPEPAPVVPRESRQKQPDIFRESRRAASAPTAVPATPAQRESVARHVQDAFSHDLIHERGGLAHDSQGPDTVARRTNDLAAELAEMLRSPAATRRAILLREVLDRPVERW